MINYNDDEDINKCGIVVILRYSEDIDTRKIKEKCLGDITQ